MEKIEEQLNSLSDMDAPSELHHEIMRRIHYRKIRPVLFSAFALFVFNFVIIALHINGKLIDADFLDMTRDFFDVFSFNFSFISTMTQNFFEIISPIVAFSAVFSFIGAVYIGQKINIYKLRGI